MHVRPTYMRRPALSSVDWEGGIIIKLLAERRTRDRKVANSNPGRSGGRIFFSSQLCVLTLIPCPFHPRVTAVARKRPRPFCQKCSRQGTLKHAYALDLTESDWADYAAVQAECGNLSRNELTRNPSGNIRPQSSQLTEPLWTDPGIKTGISVCKLISTSKNKQKSAGGE